MNTQARKTGISLKKLLPLIVIITVAVVGFFTLGDFLNFETLRDNRESLIAWRDSNYVLAALVYIIVYIVVVAFSLPGGLVMTLTGSFLFGWIPGAVFTIIGASIGATAIFLAAKTGLGDALHRKLHATVGEKGVLAKMERGLHENELSYLFLMRLVPAVPFFVANLAPAFLGVKLRNYVITTVFGIIPGTLVFSSVGAGLGEVFARGETPDLDLLFEWQVLGPILGLCFLAVLPILVKSFKKNKGQA